MCFKHRRKCEICKLYIISAVTGKYRNEKLDCSFYNLFTLSINFIASKQIVKSERESGRSSTTYNVEVSI